MSSVGSKLRMLLIDIGGCEGCALSVMRAFPQISNLVDLRSKYLGNLDLSIKYDIAVITGPVCLNDRESIELLKTIRSNSKIVIAFGSCSSVGGIVRFCRGGQNPKPEHRVFQPINSVIEVDYAIPGCPPAPQVIFSFLTCLSRGTGYFLNLFASVAKIKRLSGFDLIDDIVLSGLCIGCGACILSCPTEALRLVEKRPDLIVEKCIRCGTCYVRCPRASQLLIKSSGVVKVKLLRGG